MSNELPTILELAMDVGRLHRDPWGIWCVPESRKGFTLLEATHEYRCETCGRTWRFRVPTPNANADVRP